MNLKSFIFIKNRYSLLKIQYKSRGFKTHPSSVNSRNVFKLKSSKQTFQNFYGVLSQEISSSLYSTVANEEQYKTKNSCSLLTVPCLEFADMTFEQKVPHSELCAALQICESIEEQMFALSSLLALPPDDIENRKYFSKVVESFLKPFFSNIKIQIFGSSLNGFGFKGCDIDMSFETFSDSKEEISYLETPNVPLVSEVMNGKISPAELSLLPPKEQLIFIHSLLLEFYKESEDPATFINAHVPLVRFHHEKYGLKCDLTCQNQVAFANTKMLYLFGKLDDRVTPLMMTIRYWAKQVELIGKGLKFNSYTISLLVIHFLQTRKDPILPSVEYLMSLSDSLGIQDMDDTSFLEIQRSVPPSKNSQTLSELLRDFFFYYLYFDFTQVICPLIGDSVPREKFFQNCSKRFRMNSICVQDPMDITHNVAELVDYKQCRKLSTELMIAFRLFQNNSNLTPAQSKWGIACFLDKTDECSIKNHNWSKNVSLTIPHVTREVVKNAKEVIKATKDQNHFTAETLQYLLTHVLLFESKPIEKHEVIEILKKHDEEIEKKKKICEFKNHYNSELIDIYQKVKKKVHINLINLEPFNNSFQLEEFQKFNLENKLLFCFECKAIKNTWLGRDNICFDSFPFNTSNQLIEKERFISIQASKQNELVAKSSKKDTLRKMDPFVFSCECYISKSPESSLLLNFRPLQKSIFNPVLGIFLKEYLPKLIKLLNDSCCH